MGQMQRVSTYRTRTTVEDGTTRVRYHDTEVVVFDDETIMLDTGGWRTATTKARMNQTANQFGLGFYVYQDNFDWFVQYGFHVVPFPGRTITLDRTDRVPYTPYQKEGDRWNTNHSS